MDIKLQCSTVTPNHFSIVCLTTLNLYGLTECVGGVRLGSAGLLLSDSHDVNVRGGTLGVMNSSR